MVQVVLFDEVVSLVLLLDAGVTGTSVGAEHVLAVMRAAALATGGFRWAASKDDMLATVHAAVIQ